MAFKKGNKLSSGRPPGSENKIGSDIKENVQKVIETLTNSIVNDITELETLPMKERLKVLEGLLNYVLPKQRSIEMKELPTAFNLPITHWITESEVFAENKERLKEFGLDDDI